MASRKRSVRECKTFNQLCEMPYDNKSYGDFWVMYANDEITLTRQPIGESAQQIISLPRRVFNHFVDAYTRQHEVPPKKRSKRNARK